MSIIKSFEEYHRELKESLNESKIKKGADIVKIMSNPVEWGEDMQDRVFTKGNNFIFADTFYYGQQQALDNLVKSWSPGGRYYEYFKNDYGIEIEIVAKYSDFKAKGKFKKLTPDGVVYVELAIKNVNESVNEGISSEAAYIHQITGSGQAGAQDFIDDNNIDAKKLADYVKQNRDTIEKYNVRDIIAGTGVGANKSFVKRFIKQFLNESNLNEADIKLANISDIDHTRIVKWMGNQYYYPSQYDINMKGKDLIITIKKMSSTEISSLKNYLKSQNYLNEAKNNFKITDFPEGSKILFNDEEEWIVVKPGMRGSGSRRNSDEITIKPFNKLAKDRNISMPIDINLEFLNSNVKSVTK
jgi:hypothetical protein